MIAQLLAAVIAQPLDATYSTAGDSNNCGLHVTLRFPSEWVTARSQHALGLVDFGTPDNSVAMALWINDRELQFPAGAERERAAPEIYRDALWSMMQRFVPEGCSYERAGTAVMGTLPAAKIYFRSPEVNGQIVGFVFERRVVLLWSMCRGAAASRFDELKPTFQAVLDSVSVELANKPLPFIPIVGAAILLAVVAVFIVRKTRAAAARSSSRKPARAKR
jgi:hypothetical protein